MAVVGGGGSFLLLMEFITLNFTVLACFRNTSYAFIHTCEFVFGKGRLTTVIYHNY
jgi:hypothetical protein